VDQQHELTADPVEDFTSAEHFAAVEAVETVATPVFTSRRARLEAERTMGERGSERGSAKRDSRTRKRERIVVKPTRASRRSAKAAATAQAAAVTAPTPVVAAATAPTAVAGASAAARPARSKAARAPRAPRPALSSRLRRPDGRRIGIHTVVVLALAAFFGTAALPAYATSAEASVTGNARTALAVQTLTGGGATAQVVSRDGFAIAESPEMLDGTMNDTVSPTVQALAVQLMGAVASGRLVGSTPNHLPEIADLAEGRAVPGCGVDYRVLQAIAVALDNFQQVGVSDINRRCTGQIEGAGTESAHYADGGGHALDFYLLNGSPLTGGDARSVELLKILDPIVPNGTGVGQIECRASMDLENMKPFSDTCNHLHIDFLKSDGPALRYG
jgi:hypothetical protein